MVKAKELQTHKDLLENVAPLKQQMGEKHRIIKKIIFIYSQELLELITVHENSNI